jgi:hypothetical protein
MGAGPYKREVSAARLHMAALFCPKRYRGATVPVEVATRAWKQSPVGGWTVGAVSLGASTWSVQH